MLVTLVKVMIIDFKLTFSPFDFFLLFTACPATGQIVDNDACVCPADQVLNNDGDACEGNDH